MGIKFDKDPLSVKRNNYLTKIVHVYIAYVVDACPRISTKNLELIWRS